MADRPSPSIEAKELMGQVRRRLARESLSQPPEAAVRMYREAFRVTGTAPDNQDARTTSSQLKPSRATHEGEVATLLNALEESLASGFEESLLAIGKPPPGPLSVRGHLGQLLILLLRRLLWWYTRSLMPFADAVGRQFHDEIALLTAMARLQEEQRAEIAELRKELRQLSEHRTDSCETER
jgi:hypothetical protein